MNHRLLRSNWNNEGAADACCGILHDDPDLVGRGGNGLIDIDRVSALYRGVELVACKVHVDAHRLRGYLRAVSAEIGEG